MLTRQHFELIARVIKNSEEDEDSKIRMASQFADQCAKENPRFNRARFFKACEL